MSGRLDVDGESLPNEPNIKFSENQQLDLFFQIFDGI